VLGNPRARAAFFRQSVKDGPSIIRNNRPVGNRSAGRGAPDDGTHDPGATCAFCRPGTED